MMKKYMMITLLLFLLMTGGAGIAFAQDPNTTSGTTPDPNTTSGTTPDPNGPAPPNDVPIDGGLAVLLAAGVGYGVKRYRRMSYELGVRS